MCKTPVSPELQVQVSRPCLGGMITWLVNNCYGYDIESMTDGHVIVSAKFKRGQQWAQAQGPKENFRDLVEQVYTEIRAGEVTTVTK